MPSQNTQVQDLRGKVALVTGASRGIGRAIALNLANRGASILGTCSSQKSMSHFETLDQAVKDNYSSSQFEAPRIVGLPLDLLAADFHDIVADKVRDEFGGKLNIIVNNAAYAEFRPIGQLDADYVHNVLQGNVQCLVLLMDTLYKRGYIQPASRVVNISSDLTRESIPFSGMAVFAAAKAAMDCLTRGWADVLSLDEKTFGTTVNSLSVGGTATDAFINANPPDRQAAARKVLEAGKSTHNGYGRPEDIADVAGLIVSDSAHWINGSVVAANGGSAKIL
ncbi:Short-chain type dehydrogenase/reductase [Colletotrichum orbiculare MAFF 240422]|uniref:Short-chain type dehydrogenase/reductase n=1 Tax=Colletotrichum orbiculare (strain 104-T / ATCC 96160 / CBS 514.97 / LARS 414 / MAFF 240422) TaxID=1213857 RepID=N4VBM4_COLOR|nr:Short-chain type dehydrogenase/reductase [Colletotrichum orbiculare MAFF 240422]